MILSESMNNYKGHLSLEAPGPYLHILMGRF